jgi:hypothetical protein
MGPDPCDGEEPSEVGAEVGADESSSSVSLDVGEKGACISSVSDWYTNKNLIK